MKRDSLEKTIAKVDSILGPLGIFVDRSKLPPPTITGAFHEGRGTSLRQWVDLSDGRQLLLKWDDTHSYVNVSLHQSDADERGTDVAYDGAALSVGAVAALVDAFSARVEEERS